MVAAPIGNGHHVAPLPIDIESLIRNVLDNAKSVWEMFKAYNELNYIAKIIDNVNVDESNINDVEEAICQMDDTIDLIKEKIDDLTLFHKILAKRAVSTMLTVQFKLGNKAADYRLGNHYVAFVREAKEKACLKIQAHPQTDKRS